MAWVHKILVWVAWVAIIGVGQKSSMGKCLATESYSTENTTSSIEHYIIVPTEFIKLYSILTLFRVFLIQMKPVCDAFLDLFSNLFSLVFFFNCGYLFCLTCKNNKKTMKEQRVKRQRKTTTKK